MSNSETTNGRMARVCVVILNHNNYNDDDYDETIILK